MKRMHVEIHVQVETPEDTNEDDLGEDMTELVVNSLKYVLIDNRFGYMLHNKVTRVEYLGWLPD